MKLDEDLRQGLDRIVPRRLERAEWEDVLERAARAPARAASPAHPWRVPALGSATLVAAAVIAVLLVAPPWRGGPSVVARAAAAVSAPPGQILEERATVTTARARCIGGGVVGVACAGPAPLSIHVWVQGAGRMRPFRAVLRRPLPPGLRRSIEIPAAPFGNALARHTGRAVVTEIGGTLGRAHVDETLVYQAYSHRLIRFTQAPTAIASDSFDPVALVRAALAAGHAQVVGLAVVDGRRVREIDLRLRDVDGHEGRATYDVDRTTYAPVRIVYHGADIVSFPFGPVFDPGTGDLVVRFSTFRVVPWMRSLVDIRARHPRAKVVCGQEFGLPDC
jgi:hypothetical protein